MELEEAKIVLRNHGWRQRDIAKYCGLSQGMVSFVLNGKHETQPEAMGKILVLAEICKQVDEMAKSILRRYKKWAMK